MKQYQDLLRLILEEGVIKSDRTDGDEEYFRPPDAL